MRIRLLLSLFIALTFSGFKFFSQTGVPYMRYTFSQDSLAGFDEMAARTTALGQGLLGHEYHVFMYHEKRQFVDNKYGIQPQLPDYEAQFLASYVPVFNGSGSNSRTIGGGNSTFNAPCVNEDFELNNFSGWTISQGTTDINSGASACIDNPCPTSISTGSLASVVSTPYADANLGITIPNSPFGGSHVSRLNTEQIIFTTNYQFRATKIKQNFPVTANNSLFDFAYYAIMDGTGNHGCCDQPYMYVKMRDCFGNLLTSCPVFSITVPGGSSCPGTGPTSWVTTSGGISRSNGWQQYSIDLAQYIGCNITIEVTVGHCAYGGHYAYAYFDSRCNQMNFNVNGNLVNAPSTSPVTATAACATTATMVAPSGLGPYLWNGPAGSGISGATSQTITTAVPGAYSISMSPVGICNPINRILNLSFPPPATVAASPSSLCTGGSNTVSVLSALGASNYTWQPGGATTSTIAVSPTITTIYTLTAKTGTCVGDYTVQVTVNQNPNLNILNSTGGSSICPGASATLIASGANTYVWNPSGSTSSIIAINPPSSVIYTVTGTSTAGCTSTMTTNVNVSPGLTPSINTSFTQTYVCSGGNVTLIGGNATTFTWLPGGANGFVVSFNPTVTTTYTMIGASGSCTGQAVQTISVNPGPSMTVSSSPANICPGGTATLSAIAPASMGYTWAPVASNASFVVVTPPAPTVYSVSGIDGMGCKSTYTVAPNIIPVPSINILPPSPTVCAGSSQTLTATGGTSYTWNPGGSTSSSIVVSPASNQTYTVTGSNGTCSNTAVATVSVIALPPVGASSSPAAICNGGTATLTGTGASSYNWLPGGLSGAIVNVSPTTNTTYTVTGTSSAGCSNTAIVNVNVNPNPVLVVTASPATICPGGVSTLSVTGGTSYTWIPGGATAFSISVSPAATTVYSVTGANAFGCTSIITVQVTVDTPPAVSISPASPTLCAGGSVVLSAVSSAVSYTWLPGGSNLQNINVSPASTTIYSVTAADGIGCSSQATAAVTVISLPPVTAAVNPAAICVGQTATLTATGATSYNWSPGGLSGSTVTDSPTSNTTYTVTGTSAGCSNTATVSLVVNTNPNLVLSATPATICPGGSSTLSATGGVTYTYSSGSNVVSPLVTTVYNITGANAAGCTSTGTVQVTVDTPPSISISPASPTLCAGSSVLLSASGATGGYTWQPGGSNLQTIVVSPPSSATFSVTGADAAGCSSQATVAVTVISLPPVTAAVNPAAICAGQTATLTATGATSYNWSPGGLSGSTVTDSPASNTTYTVTGTTLGCSNTATVSLVVNANPNVNVSATPATICPGGSSTLNPTGALSYTYSSGSNVVSPAVTTIYTITGVNASGCSSTATVQVTVSAPPTVIASASSPSICAGNSATLTASGTAASFTWSPGGSNASFIVVSPASTQVYTLIGSNGIGCTGQSTVMVSVVPVPNVSASGAPAAICVGGTATLTSSGATNYTWQPGGLNGSLVTVTPSLTTTYTVYGDVSGCTSSSFVTVVVNATPNIVASAAPATICPGGSSTLSATGGITYTYSSGSNVVSPASTTNYTVFGTNPAGCVGSGTVDVTVSAPPAVAASASSPSICAGSNVTLTASGASTYTWIPGGSNATVMVATPLSTTAYTVIGSNGIGCSSQGTVLVLVVPVPVVSAGASPATICSGQSATLTGTGATNYTWNPTGLNSSSVAVNPASTTTYSLTGEQTGCSTTTFVTVSVNPTPNIVASAAPNAICPGGSSTLSATGAITYTYSSGSNVVSPAATTNYTVFGTDALGCVGSGTVDVTVSSSPIVIANASSPSICAGSSATLTASGTSSSFTWSPGGANTSSIVVSPASTQVYTLDGASGAGCAGQGTVMITVSPIPSVGASISSTVICSGNSATLTGTGATSYTWNPGGLTGNTVSVSPPVTTTYTMIGGSAGCTSNTFVTLTVNPTPTLNATASPANVCSGVTSTLSASNATSYVWYPPGTSTNPYIVIPVGTSVYTVVGTSAAGCTATDVVTVNVGTPPTLGISASSPSLCAGNSVTLTPTGTATSFTWLPGGSTGPQLVDTPASSTTYTLIGASAAGCTNQAVVTINVFSVPNLIANASPASICSGNSSTLTVSGAPNFTWNPGGGNTSPLVVTPSGTTIYTVTGDNGNCTSTAVVTVSVNTLPTVVISASNPSICLGSSATLSASGTLTYSWLPGGSTSNSIVVTPTSTTVYTVTGSNGAGCSNIATFALTVGFPSTITANAAPATICQGFTTSLSATGASAGSYTWSPGGSIGSAITATPLTSTTFTVLNDNGSCIASATVNVSVTPAPIITATASPAGLCLGSTATLTASGSSGSYTWVPGFLTGGTVNVSPTASTDYTVVGVGPTGCPNFAVVSVTVYGTPTVGLTSNPPALCAGGTATLTPSGATSYTLNPGGLTGTSFTVSPANTTTYNLIGDNGGCASGSASLVLTVSPLPVVTATNSPNNFCAGNTVTLTAGGTATSYTWNPNSLVGITVTDTPVASVEYTVSGSDINGCIGIATVSITVNPLPSISIVPSATAICEGGTVSLTANGGSSYTWSPTGILSNSITDSPTVTTTYTVSSEDANTCVGSATVSIGVVPIPTINVTPVHAVVCSGSSLTLTATGAANYTWLPSGTNSSVSVETPTNAVTNYTVIGDNGGNCPVTFTVDVATTPLPANVTALANGTISCAFPTVEIDGSSTSTNVSYSWTGPSSYTSGIQNPTVSAWGNYTLAVTDTLTGCVATATVDVITDGSIPSVTATTSGSITCAAPVVTLNAANTTTNPGYAWSGPNGFSSTQQSFTTAVPGDYTVAVVDISSTCKVTTTVHVGSHTFVSISASITPATCNGATANNDGTIKVFGFDVLDKFDIVAGTVYSGSATYSTATSIPSNSILTSNLANPTTTLAYTLRLFDAAGCIKDTTLILQPTDCVPKALGISKDVAVIVSNADGSYDVTYKVVAKNYSAAALSSISFTEDLSATFPAPTEFTVTGTPSVTPGSSLAVNAAFDGSVHTLLTDSTSGVLAAGASDSILFTVRVTPHGYFGPFNNYIAGKATNTASLVVRDSSAAGLNPDPDGDGNPINNTSPTVVNFTPQAFFALTKTGTVGTKQSDNTYDISYSITVYNFGNDTLRNIFVKDSLFNKAVRHPASYTIKSTPSTADANLIANGSYNGNSDINLVNPASKLPPHASATLVFVINVTTDTVKVFKNSAYGYCINSHSIAAADTSNNGTNPDSNGNGIWNEPADNMPTVLSIGTHTLFVPEGFSPDGDGVNDFFKIPGLPDGQNEFTVFNRWGNKVYYQSHYDSDNNPWNGRPNVSGILGSDRVPQGTYYYILHMKGTNSTLTGFIVIQY